MAVAPLVGKQLDSVRLATARLNIWEGSVRSSKTVCSLLAWIKFVREGPPGNLLMAGKTERTLKRNIIDPLTEMLGEKRCRLVAGSGELWLLGRRVYLAGANDERSQEKIRGLTLTGAYVDEISTVPASFWTMLLSRLSVEGARAFGSSNPDGPAHWLKKDYLDRAALWLTHDGSVLRTQGNSLDLARFSFRLRDNPHLPAAYVASLENEYVGLWYKRFIQGLWVAAEGAVYDMWDPDVHVVDIVPPVQAWLCVGLDYGTTAPTAALLLGLCNTGGGDDGKQACLYLVDEWRWDSRQRHRQLTDTEISAHLRTWLNSVRFPGTRLHGPSPKFLIIDPSAASLKVQCVQDGWPVADADNAVLDGIRLVSSLLAKKRLKAARSCTGWIEEIGGYSWDDKAAAAGEDKPVKVDDHSLDAGRYAAKTTQGLWFSSIPLTNPVAA